MATVTTKPIEDAPHSHLEIHALIDGGYVVREGRFDGSKDGHDECRWMWRSERAAFTTLDEAVKWIARQMVKKSSAER